MHAHSTDRSLCYERNVIYYFYFIFFQEFYVRRLHVLLTDFILQMPLKVSHVLVIVCVCVCVFKQKDLELICHVFVMVLSLYVLYVCACVCTRLPSSYLSRGYLHPHLDVLRGIFTPSSSS